MATPPQDTPQNRMAHRLLDAASAVQSALTTLASGGPELVRLLRWRAFNLELAPDYFVGTPLEDWAWEELDLVPLETLLADLKSLAELPVSREGIQSWNSDGGATAHAPKDFSRPEINRINDEAAQMAKEHLKLRKTPKTAKDLVSALKAKGWPGFPYLAGKEGREFTDEATLYRTLQSRKQMFRLFTGSRWGLAEWPQEVSV